MELNDISTSGIIQTSQLKLKTSPSSSDYVNLYSYARFINGQGDAYTDSTGTYDKWSAFAAIGQSASTSAFFELKLMERIKRISKISIYN